MLPNIPTRSDAKTTYTSNNYLFHVMVENGLIYLATTDTDIGRRKPYGFLGVIKEEFRRRGLSSRAQFAEARELQEEFQEVFAEQMEKFSATDDTGDHLTVLQSQVNEVKDVMTQNIEKVLERGENLEELMVKTTDLEEHSASFQKTARKVKRRMWWQNLKMKIILALVIFTILFIIILIILFSTGVLPPKHSPHPVTPHPVTTVTPHA
ncbi:hypothetical protein LSAT2_004554 [Lamellibrachia satsuma]|nr:hypothetical protein LSAT2_004554 [Lamellibrachia satsuma]